MLLDLAASLLALGTVTTAAYTDLREGVVPNKLTFPMIAVGIAVCAVQGAYRGDIFAVARGLAGAGVGFALGFLLYRFSTFGGGDVKLLAAVGALLPTAPAWVAGPAAPAFAGIPLFPLTVLVDGLLVSSPFIVGYALLCLARGQGISAREVPVSRLEPGMVPAEAVWVSGGEIKKGASLPEGHDRCYADPSDVRGLKGRQIEGLLELRGEGEFDGLLKVKRTFPFAPVLAAGTFAAVFFGNLYWAFLIHFL